MLHTTFRLLKKARACRKPYLMLAQHLGGIKKYGADTPIPFAVGLDEKLQLPSGDLFWGLRHGIPLAQTNSRDQALRLFATDCAVKFLHEFEAEYPQDYRCRNAIKVARKMARKPIGDLELQKAEHDADRAYQRTLIGSNAEIAAECARDALTYNPIWAAQYCYVTSDQWQRDRLRQYLEDPNTKPLPLPRKPRRKAA